MGYTAPKSNGRLLIVLSFALASMISTSGCLLDPYPSGSDNPPGPFTVTTSTWECYMVDVGRWYAIVGIRTHGEDTEVPINELELDGGLEMGYGDAGPSYMYNDTDGDGIISMHDVIEFYNLTKLNITTYNLTWMDQVIVEITVEWDYGDLGSFLITVSNGPVKKDMDGQYAVTNEVREARDGSLLMFDDLKITYESSDGLSLDRVNASLIDSDGNGFISKGDSIRFNNLTIEYRGGQVFYWVSGHLVGRSHLSQYFRD